MTEHPQDFEQLRRLLVVKRYEQPPPGYFHSFSREVIVRIRAGEMGETEVKWWAFEGSWLKWLWDACERRPAFAGGVGVAFCGFFAAATFISMNDVAEPVVQTVPGNQLVAVQNGPAGTPVNAAVTDVSYTDFPGMVRSDSVDRPLPSLFTATSGMWQPQSAESATLKLIETH
jgi:hypothetical protein